MGKPFCPEGGRYMLDVPVSAWDGFGLLRVAS